MGAFKEIEIEQLDQEYCDDVDLKSSQLELDHSEDRFISFPFSLSNVNQNFTENVRSLDLR